MGTYTKISSTAFEEMQLDAGILLNTFNVASPNVQDSHIITATTGGINAVCTPTYEDIAEDVDNAPNNMKEYKKLTGWDCRISGTALSTSHEVIKRTLGSADTTDNTTYKKSTDTEVVSGKTYYTRTGTSPNYTYTVVSTPTGNPSTSNYYELDTVQYTVKPRRDIDLDDFSDVWWVGDRADGGFLAIKLINALSTGGFSLQTTKNGKGQISFELTGHVSSANQTEMPMVFYSVEG